MRKLFAFFIFLLCLRPAQAQQELGLVFLTHLAQVPTQANPATFTDNRFNLALPNIQLGFQNSAFSLGDLLRTHAGGGKSIVLDQALGNMSPTGNFLRSSVSINGAALSFQLLNKVQLSFFQNTQVDFQLGYGKDLPDLIWRGNGAFLGRTMEIGPSVNFLAFNEYGVGLAVKLHEKFTAGVNVKYLNGLVGVRTISAGLSMMTSEEYYQLNVQSDMVFRTGGLTDVFNDRDVLADTSTEGIINGGNNGIGLDIGMSIKVLPRLSVDLVMQDVGKIYWSKNALEQVSNGSYQFDGLEIRPFDENSDASDAMLDLDSISSLLEFKASSKPFYTQLPQRFSFIGRYELNPRLMAGAAFHYESWNNINNVAVTAYLQKQIANLFYVGIMPGWHARHSFVLGANATLQLGPFQLFAITDNLLMLIDPIHGQTTNFRAGFNIAFLRKKGPKTTPVSQSKNERYDFKGND
jgi:hypothetical protein